jgi:hypothetical protein
MMDSEAGADVYAAFIIAIAMVFTAAVMSFLIYVAINW